MGGARLRKYPQNAIVLIYNSQLYSAVKSSHLKREEIRRNTYLWGDNRQGFMKTIEVVAAVIIKDGKVFATQRGYGEWKGWWEFPGGKMEPEETPQEALVREIREELEAEVTVGELLNTVEWDYPDFHLTMHCYTCCLKSESIHLNEHEAEAWLTGETLGSVRWLPADEGLIPLVRDIVSQG